MSGGAVVQQQSGGDGGGGGAHLDAPRHARALATPTPGGVVLGTWALLAAVALAQVAAARLLPSRAGGAADVVRLRGDLTLLALWALATPAIVRLARSRPVRGRAAPRHLAVQVVAATAFIVVANVAIRLPLLRPPWSLGAAGVARDTLLGLARFGPAALLVYGVVATLGHLAWRAADATRQRAKGTPLAPPSPLADAHVDAHPEVAAATVPPDRVVVREWNRVHLVRPDDIEWIEADDNYVVVHVAAPAGPRTYKGRGRIGDLAAQLDPSRFVRIHRSAIVRAECVRELQPLGKGDLAVILRGGKMLRAARGRRAALEAALGVAR